jgi:predicted PurR-regulated permease PerM
VVPPPPESVREWPVIGDRTYNAWALAATNLEGAVQRFSPQLKTLGGWILSKMAGLAGAIGHTLIALIVAGFLLTWAAEGRAAAEAIFSRLGGPRGPKVVQLIGDTISSVFKGVLGVALIQAALAGIGLFFADVPAWGVWTVVVLIIAVIQVPAIIVLGPLAFWAFANADSTIWGIVWAVYLIVAGASDNFLKPILLGRGLETPMLVVLLGAIGGLILQGIIGLFVGAVVLAIGYELAHAWLEDEGPPGRNEVDTVGESGDGAPAPA